MDLIFASRCLQTNTRHLDGIVFTHEHADHTAGLDDIRPFFFRQGKINMYMTTKVLNELTRRFDYIFNDENKYPGAPSVQVKTIDKSTPFDLGNKTGNSHRSNAPQHAYSRFRLENFAYLTDVKTIEANEKEKAKKPRCSCAKCIAN